MLLCPEMKKALRVLVISDTHDRLSAKIPALAKSADEIWHLGDVCLERILDELRLAGAPLTVVRGNCDNNGDWPLVVDLVRGGVRFRLQHIPPDPRTVPDGSIDVLLHGHTHVPRQEKVGHVLFLNPGCVTRPNRGAAPSVGWLEISADGQLNWKLESLR